MSEKLRIMGKLAASRLLVLHSNQQPANYRGDDIDHQALEWLHLIRKGGDVIYQ